MGTGDNGSMTFWDYATGTPFQNMEDIPQPGSLEAEAGLFCSTFDMTGTRLITGGADKTIKVGQVSCSNVDLCLRIVGFIRSMQNRHHDQVSYLNPIYVLAPLL